MSAGAWPAGEGAPLGMIFEVLLQLVASEAVMGALAVVLVACLGAVIRHWVWARHVVALGIRAYRYAETEGWVHNLKGHAKLSLFMDHFEKTFRDRFGGKPPSPKDRAIAVEAMERQVQLENTGAR